jgi:RNA polymerase sigma-70 factor (sigma-E family)
VTAPGQDVGDVRDTGRQAAWYTHDYDLDAGLTRFEAWLSEHTAAGILTADEAVTQLYSNHYRSLVRLAGLLVRDEPTAEEVVQECFIAMHSGWGNLRDEDQALGYLKQAVVNRSRSVLRHRSVVDRNAPKPAPDPPSAEEEAVTRLERSSVISALRALPDRQRQALVLRYYADLSEPQIAAMMGVSKGAVKSYTARGMSSLRRVLEQTSS